MVIFGFWKGLPHILKNLYLPKQLQLKFQTAEYIDGHVLVQFCLKKLISTMKGSKVTADTSLPENDKIAISQPMMKRRRRKNTLLSCDKILTKSVCIIIS